ncbi:MAG: exosome complex protein Rrp42 [Candidatus Micrarchaeota archaeon]|nr:exosome complex protein Rrp42 [Candidatus Micrarchaeota archaeon]
MTMDAMDTVKASHIRTMIAGNAREDGRGAYDFRDIKLTAGLLQNAEGSAQAQIGNTTVLAGVKLDIEEPMPDTPKQGNLIMSAELLPLASEAYETGPPSPQAIEFGRVVDRGIRHGNCIDLESLFIEDEKVWTVFIDLYVLNYDGNLFDAGTLAAMGALMNTKVPKVEDGEAVREDRTKKMKINNIVTSTTFAKIKDKIILDPNGDEEMAADCRLTIATDGEKVKSMQKGKSGGLFKSEIEEMLGTAFNKHKGLKDILESSQV